MPTYSYRCANCGYAFDQYQAFTDDSLTVCPNCGEPQLRKVFNSIGVTFNGSGFYRTDSRSGSSASDAASPAKTDAAPKSEKKTESQSESKSASAPKSSGSGNSGSGSGGSGTGSASS